MDLIDREKLKSAACDYCCENLRKGLCARGYCEYLRLIDEQPKVDIEPVRHGKWIYDLRHTPPKCSECGKRIHSADWSEECNFCGHCGAKMDRIEQYPEKIVIVPGNSTTMLADNELAELLTVAMSLIEKRRSLKENDTK